MEVIDLVKEIPFPNPSRFKEGINNLVLYWSENQAIDCFHAMNDVEEYLRKKYNIGLEDFS